MRKYSLSDELKLDGAAESDTGANTGSQTAIDGKGDGDEEVDVKDAVVLESSADGLLNIIAGVSMKLAG